MIDCLFSVQVPGCWLPPAQLWQPHPGKGNEQTSKISALIYYIMRDQSIWRGVA